MEHCGPSLYSHVHNNFNISTHFCSQVLYGDTGNCDHSYLYLKGDFVYTFSCKMETKELKDVVYNLTNFSVVSNNNTTGSKKNETNSSKMNGSQKPFNITKRNATIRNNVSAAWSKNESTVAVYSPIEVPIILTVSGVILLSVLLCAIYVYRRQQEKKKKIARRPSSVMPDIIRQHNKQNIQREVRFVLKKMINTVCRWHGQMPYRTSAPETAPPIPPKPPFVKSRDKTLQYLRRTNPHSSNPHSSIQNALSKPLEGFDSGKRRAKLLRREAALEAEKQRKQKNRQSRLRRIVRLRELHQKQDDK